MKFNRGTLNTLPFSLLNVAIKGCYYNFSYSTNERVIKVFTWEHISWKNSLDAINQIEKEKFHIFFYFEKEKTKRIRLHVLF